MDKTEKDEKKKDKASVLSLNDKTDNNEKKKIEDGKDARNKQLGVLPITGKTPNHNTRDEIKNDFFYLIYKRVVS